jgi:hypothetical protein
MPIFNRNLAASQMKFLIGLRRIGARPGEGAVAAALRVARPYAGEVLQVERAKRPFHGRPDPDDSLLHARPKKRDPQMATHH